MQFNFASVMNKLFALQIIDIRTNENSHINKNPQSFSLSMHVLAINVYHSM